MHQFCLPCIQHAVLIDSRCPLCRNDIISIEHGGARIPVRHKRLSGDPMAEHQEPLPSSSSDDEERAEGIVDPDYVDDAFEDQHDSPVNVPVETLSLRRRRRPTTRPGPYRPRARAALHTTVAIPNATETGVLSYDSVRQRITGMRDSIATLVMDLDIRNLQTFGEHKCEMPRDIPNLDVYISSTNTTATTVLTKLNSLSQQFGRLLTTHTKLCDRVYIQRVFAPTARERDLVQAQINSALALRDSQQREIERLQALLPGRR